MQVYRVQQIEEAIKHEANYFRNFQDIVPSLKISYSQAKDLRISHVPTSNGGPIFFVEGSFKGVDEKEVPFKHTFHCTRLPVWDSPTHM